MDHSKMATQLHHKQAHERDPDGRDDSEDVRRVSPAERHAERQGDERLTAGEIGTAYDRDMYRHVVMHHREGVQMIDRYLSRLQNADVRSMAEKMRADQTREIAQFERKAAHEREGAGRTRLASSRDDITSIRPTIA